MLVKEKLSILSSLDDCSFLEETKTSSKKVSNINDLFNSAKDTSDCVEEKEVLFVDLNIDMFRYDRKNSYIVNKLNQEIREKYFRNETGNSCYYPIFNLRNKPFFVAYRELQNDFAKLWKNTTIKLTGYYYNPDHHRFADKITQAEYEEDCYREKEEKPVSTLDDLDLEMLDRDLYNTLYKVLFKAIETKRLCIYNLENLVFILDNAMECQAIGVSCRMSNLAMSKAYAEFNKLLSDPEFTKWIKDNNYTDFSDMYMPVMTRQKVYTQVGVSAIFDETENEWYEVPIQSCEMKDVLKELSLYSPTVEAYQKVLRQISKTSNERLDYFRELVEANFNLKSDRDLAIIEDILSNYIPDTEVYYDDYEDDSYKELQNILL